MKSLTAIFPFFLLLLTACSDTPVTAETAPEKEAIPASTYPAIVNKVFSAHGGLDAWNEFSSLSYAMGSADAKETQFVDLKSRRELIERPGATIGYDGEKSWVVAEGEYKGDPIFYRNLMFYFYAMPWVLADPGIRYEDTESLVFDGETFPGIKVSYDDGIGLSPKDNYFLHYDDATGKMRWLGYTVTGRTGETSDQVKWIEYPTWSNHGGVELPDSLVWYTLEDNLPVAPRSTRVFSDVQMGKEAPSDEMFRMPEGATVYEADMR